MEADGRPERQRLDFIEYLGFCPTKDRVVRADTSQTSPEDLRVEPATEVGLEVYGQPEAQVRVYVRPDTPTLIVLGLLEKIATALELAHFVYNERDRASNDEQRNCKRSAGDDEEQGCDSCRRCQLPLDETSSIRDTLGLLCIKCAEELRML
jgi:hypothetical protein